MNDDFGVFFGMLGVLGALFFWGALACCVGAAALDVEFQYDDHIEQTE